MSTERLIIDFPSDMPLGLILKGLAEAAKAHGMQIKPHRTQVPRGTYFELVPVYERPGQTGDAA